MDKENKESIVGGTLLIEIYKKHYSVYVEKVEKRIMKKEEYLF